MPQSDTPFSLPFYPGPHPASLAAPDMVTLRALYMRGTPANTQRAYERDLLYIAAWKELAFEQALTWPETEATALRFLLDHSRDLTPVPADDPARVTAAALIGVGLRRSLACPAAATLDRRIASWRAFHRMKNLASPFDAPLLKQARAKGRRAVARLPVSKSTNPITRDILLRLTGATGPGLRGLRDRAILLLGWASGGRRRSEIVSLDLVDLDLSEFDTVGLVWLRLPGTKTTSIAKTPRLVLKGQAARAVVAWIDASGITAGPLFRRISRTDRLGQHRLTPDAIGLILRRVLRDAGLPAGFASPHGLRAGFLTQAALDGVQVQAAMRLSLHRSVAQAQRYYDDIELTDNPATDMLD
jgi:integrase